MKTDAPFTQILDELLIRITDFPDNTIAAQAAASFGHAVGLSKINVQMLVTSVYEIGNNILVHASSGEIAVQVIEQNNRKGVRIIGTDRGPGIPDITQAMKDGYTTQPKFRSLGLGLGGVSRLMDDMIVDSHPGQGTRIVASKWR